MNPDDNNGVPDSLMPDAAPPSNGVGNTAVGVPESIEIFEQSPDVSQEHEQSEVAVQQHRSRVNGLGMWSAWERNFSNKFKACLDLVDNAVDAALWNSDDEDEEERELRGRPLTERERWKKQSGNIHISTEKHRLAMEYYDSDDDETDEDHQQDVEGNDAFGTLGSDSEDPDAGEKISDFRLIDDENTLCLHNDCVKPVKELRKILDVYNSDKTDSAIGENGVGVKQAAAAMSDLSIVVTTRIDEEPLLMDYADHSNQRIRKVLVSVGVLAKKMQAANACIIPSWTLPIQFDIDEQRKKENTSNINGVDDEGELGKHFDGNSCMPVVMRELFKITDSSYLFKKVMKEFGRASVKNRRLYAMRRLAKHIELMIMSFKKKNKEVKPPHPHQYLMLLHKFGKHKSSRKEGDRNASIVKARNDLDNLLRDLTYEVPRTYLHIPPAPYFKFRVNQKLLKFQYWERSVRTLLFG